MTRSRPISTSGRLVVVLALMVGLAMAGASAGPAWAGFDDGVTAFYRQDYTRAIAEWRPLAERGDIRSQFNMGMMYERGFGVEKNEAEAARWYRRAAEQGYAFAQHSLGLLYAEGRGMPHDAVQALFWLGRAAATYPSGGRKLEAEMLYGSLADRASLEDRAHADDMVRDWRPKKE
ncbi:MAG: sel1 repeat family protein [Rhodospirillales bacterium]|nr:sel1 repeat family protein [Rhodospirillales bacterium]